MIPYGRQDIRPEDVEAVLAVLNSDFLTQGPKVPEFEQMVAKKVGANNAVAVNSATSALHVACLALELGPGDYLWTSPITFVASANCGLYCGARVDFVDIDPGTFNMCPKALEKKLQAAKKVNKLPKVVIPVHMCGQSADMQAIKALSNEYGFRIIEDASHAIGGKYKGKYIGDCQYSDITVFSFHPVKIITTAEGGIAVTNNKKLASSMARLRSHGVTRDENLMEEKSHGPWYYQQIELGFNYRMTELQAALGIAQLERLDSYVESRTVLADRYDELFERDLLQCPQRTRDADSSWHLYVVRLREADQHLNVFNKLRADGIGVNLHYIPVHIQPYYSKLGFRYGDFPQAENYYKQAISIPLFANMTLLQQDKVASSLQKAIFSGGKS